MDGRFIRGGGTNVLFISDSWKIELKGVRWVSYLFSAKHTKQILKTCL